MYNVIIEKANKIINKQGECYVGFFLQIVVIYASKRWRLVGTQCIFHSRSLVNFSGFWVRLKIEQQNYTRNFYSNFLNILLSVKSSRLSRFCHIGHCENCLCFDATIRNRKSMSDKNIHQKINGENLHIWAFEWKNHFSKTETFFAKKNNTIIRTYWASKYESRSERKFGVAAVCLIHADVGS